METPFDMLDRKKTRGEWMLGKKIAVNLLAKYPIVLHELLNLD